MKPAILVRMLIVDVYAVSRPMIVGYTCVFVGIGVREEVKGMRQALLLSKERCGDDIGFPHRHE